MIEAALDDLRADGNEIAAAVLVGGREKLPAGGIDAIGEVRVETGDDPRVVLYSAIREHRPDAVFDLSDEPVLDYRKRHELAAIALFEGVAYEGADFSFRPPPRPRLCTKPSIAIIGTGKRTGKTAVAGFAARSLLAAGHRPVVVAMGRGGPAEPAVLHGDEVELTPRQLLELADSGEHAASDYIEDALLGRVTTVGCRRCGGGLAGAVAVSNVARGIMKANELPGDLIVLEGSGSAIPPAHADVTVLIAPGAVPEEHLKGYMGPYRLLLMDFGVVTMCEDPFASPSQVAATVSRIRDAFRYTPGGGEEGRAEAPIVRTVFRPSPTRSVEGANVFVATTAPETAGDSITRHLEAEYGCEVVGISHSLSDRSRLEKELRAMAGRADTLLCEIKAAGIDVATRRALERGLDVIYMDNVPQGVGGDDPVSIWESAAELARTRFERDAS